MNNSNENLSHDLDFTYIYIEKCARNHPKTEHILSHLSRIWGQDDLQKHIIPINNYRDIFYTKKDDNKRSLILSAGNDKCVFPGSPVCQDFDERYFYYASSAKNCLFNCEYCYLKGMYPSSDLVINVNIQSVFDEVKKLLDDHPVYLCISYDSDLLALETLTGSIQDWMEFAATESDLRVECRTKCARTDLWDDLTPDEDFIFAFTLSPQEIIDKYEHRTASLEARIHSVQTAMACGHPVRLCFDPMIYDRDWKQYYDKMLDTLSDSIDWDKIRDISIGSFRISSTYLKRMRSLMPDSTVVQFPFDLKGGVYQYPDYLKDEMMSFMLNRLTDFIPKDKIYEI